MRSSVLCQVTVEVVEVSCHESYSVPPWGAFPVIPDLEEAPGACQGYWRDYVSWLAWELFGIPSEEQGTWTPDKRLMTGYGLCRNVNLTGILHLSL